MTTDIKSLLSVFESRYRSPVRVVARAPGRVNLIGEHVDYNDGIVLPFAIRQEIAVLASRAASSTIDVYSVNLDACVSIQLASADADCDRGWTTYVRGVAALLERSGVALGGAQLVVGGNLPAGAGVSSSAALCVTTGLALSRLFEAELGGLELAKLAQQVEHEFAGTPCGIMDPYAVIHAREDHAILLDCRACTHQDVPLPTGSCNLLLVPSGVRHSLADGAYESRVRSCQSAVRQIQAANPGVRSLRDVSRKMLEACGDTLDAVALRRARHVVTEIERVRETVDALRERDDCRVGSLLSASQASLRDDYEVSCEEVDDLIDVLRCQPGVHGARMVGGGFGGMVLALVDAASRPSVEQAIQNQYYESRQMREQPFVVRPGPGASVTLRS